MRRELAPLLRGHRAIRVDGVLLFDMGNAVVAVGGIGRWAAGRAAEALVQYASPEILVSAGIAGALRGELQVGDVVTAQEVIDVESGTEYATSGGMGILATVSAITNSKQKPLLHSRYSADVVDMEAAAVAKVARKYGRKFAAVKAVSDELGFVMPPLDQFVDADCNFGKAKFTAFLATHPQWWLPVVKLSRNARTASLSLSHAIEHLMGQYATSVSEEKRPQS